MDEPGHIERPKLSWKEGLFLVGPDPLTSPYYSSGALILFGAGYATPLFQIGLYGFLFLLAPLYIEAVLLTLSNGGTYVMTRYALSRMGKWAVIAAASVGVVISFSYVATAIVSLLSYSEYLASLVYDEGESGAFVGILLSAVPALGFGIWVMPGQWRRTVLTVGGTTIVAMGLSAVFVRQFVIMLAPLMLLFMLNNFGLRESVQVSKTIFLINLVVMAVTIVAGVVHLIMYGGYFGNFMDGVDLLVQLPSDPAPQAAAVADAGAVGEPLRGLSGLHAALIPAALGSSILGASGVESVMNIPEELERPRQDVRKIYYWMLSILLVVGGSISLLVFTVLPPDDLVTKHKYLLAALGDRTVAGVTGSDLAGQVWAGIVVATGALMLIGATNTGFAGARGLWVTMARDNLLPRFVLRLNERGVFSRINLLMLLAIFALAGEGGANGEILERWYGATFGLVMISGVVAFMLLRRFKAEDRRIYVAPFNVTIGGVKLPLAAFIGIAFLSFALLGLYDRYSQQILELRELLITVLVVVGIVLVSYNHRPIVRATYNYFRRVIETVEGGEIETEDRTIVVAVGGARIGDLLRQSLALARAQSRVTGIPYRQIVVFHMTKTVRREYVYRVTRESLRPAGVQGNVVRIHTELAELAPDDLKIYLAVVPNSHPELDNLHAAMEELIAFHERHGFRGHIVMIGDYGVGEDDKRRLQERLQGSTLVAVPV